MACMSASSPTAAVTAGGQPTVSSGSREIASRGRRCWCEMPVFTRCSGTSRTATAVTSEPVPAVVGSATTGRSGPGTARPPPIGGLTQSRISPPWVASSGRLHRVERGAAAQPDEAVVVAGPGVLRRRLHGGDGRLAGRSGVDLGLDAGLPDRGDDGIGDAEAREHLVRDHEGAPHAEPREVMARLARGAGAEQHRRHEELADGFGFGPPEGLLWLAGAPSANALTALAQLRSLLRL